MAALAKETFRTQPRAALEVAKRFEAGATPTISRAARIHGFMGAHTELRVPGGGQGYAWVDCDTGNTLP